MTSRCSARGEGVENVSAVELAAGNQVERGDEEADPAGDENGVRREAGRTWGRMRIPAQQASEWMQADGERFAAEADDGSGASGAPRHAEHKADGDGDGRGDIAGERAVDSHVHQRVAVEECGSGS